MIIAALCLTLAIVAGFAVYEWVIIQRMAAIPVDDLQTNTNGELADDSETGNAIVDLVCASLTEKSDQWSFDKGVLTHSSGLVLTLGDDGKSVMFKKGETTALVGGNDAVRIRDAAVARNIKVSFSEMVKSLS